MVPIVPSGVSAMPFGNVRRYRHGRAANLGDEAEPFVSRQKTPDSIRLNDEPNAELPDMQIPIATNHEELENG